MSVAATETCYPECRSRCFACRLDDDYVLAYTEAQEAPDVD